MPLPSIPFYARAMIILWTTLLLIGSNLFMTYAWYGHLRDFKDKPLWFVIILSWMVAAAWFMFTDIKHPT